jgi:hypothetical protein
MHVVMIKMKMKRTKIMTISNSLIEEKPEYTVEEITEKINEVMRDLVQSEKIVTFDVMINVLMNYYVSVIVQFIDPKMIEQTIRDHVEHCIKQIKAAKLHEED